MTNAEPAGILEAVWIKRFHRGPTDPTDRARLIKSHGLEGNVRQGRHRQVTIIEAEEWSRLMQEIGGSLDPSSRRANLMVRGLPLKESRNRTLQIGAARIRILGETKPCERMEQACPGLRDAMHPEWRGGAFGEVLEPGEIALGDEVSWVADDQAPPGLDGGT
jgi:MOSC domain-containing protein YiiM